MSKKERENTEEERVETAKEIIEEYNPAGNTKDDFEKDDSNLKTDEFGKRKRIQNGDGKKVNPSS